jgi:hypothetical protein
MLDVKPEGLYGKPKGCMGRENRERMVAVVFLLQVDLLLDDYIPIFLVVYR